MGSSGNSTRRAAQLEVRLCDVERQWSNTDAAAADQVATQNESPMIGWAGACRSNRSRVISWDISGCTEFVSSSGYGDEPDIVGAETKIVRALDLSTSEEVWDSTFSTGSGKCAPALSNRHPLRSRVQ